MALFVKYTTRISNYTVDGTYLYNDVGVFGSFNSLILSNNISTINNESNYKKYVIIQDGPNPNLKSLYFEASKKNYVKFIKSFQTYNGGLSFTFWFKAGSNPDYSRFFDFGSGINQDNIICYINSNQIAFSVHKKSNNTATSYNVIPNVLDNKWHHIGWTLNTDKTWIIYLDGVLYKTYTNQNYPDSTSRNSSYIAKSNWSNHPYFTGNITDFRIYNSIIDASLIQQIYYEGLGSNQFNISNSDPKFNRGDLLYSYIFTDLSDKNSGYNDCKNCSFDFDKSVNMKIPIVNGPQGCKDECSKNNKCTSYSYDNNNKKCFNYINQFPNNIYNNVEGIDSGYNLNFPFDYTQLNDIQKNNVKKIVSNTFLNNKFTPNKNINYTNCNTITENSTKTFFNNDPKCIFNLMRSNNISNNLDFIFDYKNNPKIMNPIGDNEIINYYNKFKKNLFNVNEKTILAPISNIGIHSPVDTETIIQPIISANEISDSIKSITQPTDTFSNQYLEDYNHTKNYKILMIILLFIILGFFIYKLNK